MMAATLGLPQDKLDIGTPLPPLWHWIYFLEGLPPSDLGHDGHPARGGFLPPVPLSNRMWAGGKLVFQSDLLLGTSVQKRSRIHNVERKPGRSGELVFVTVVHDLLHQGRVAVTETQDIVYKVPTLPTVMPPSPAMPEPLYTKSFVPDSTLLFRYSALTFNGHRIHYDVDYCRDIEGYANLVVHGPLNATMLAGYAQDIAGRSAKEFSYRALQPSTVGNELTLNAAPDDNGITAWISLPGGAGVAMRAEIKF